MGGDGGMRCVNESFWAGGEKKGGRDFRGQMIFKLVD